MAKRDRGEHELDVTIEEVSMDGRTILGVLGRESNPLAGRRAWEVYCKGRPNQRIQCRHAARIIADSHGHLTREADPYFVEVPYPMPPGWKPG